MSSENISILNRILQFGKYKLLNILLLFSLFVFSFLLPIVHVSNPDTSFHLKTGEIIWQTKEILKKDIFSYTQEGKEWVNNQWLFQVISYLLFSLGDSIFNSHSQKSFAFLLIFQGFLLSLITFFIISSILQKGISTPIAVAVALLVLLASQYRLSLRPETYSLLFIVLYIWLFEKFRKGGNNIIFFLPFLQWLWLLIHGGFVIGFLLIALFLVSELIAKAIYSQKSEVRSQEFGARSPEFEIRDPESGVRNSKLEIRNSQFAIRNYIAPPISNSQLKKLVFAFFFALFLPLLNPFFYKAYLLPFQVQFGKEFQIMRAAVTEWMPIKYFFTQKYSAEDISNFYFYISIAILSVIGFIFQKEKKNLFYCLLFLCVLPMPYVHTRHLGVFAVSSFMIIALGMQGVFQRITHLLKKDRLVKGVSFLLSLLVLLYLIWQIQARVKHPDFGIGTDEQWLPAKACEFLEKTEVKGPMFNVMGWGGYLLWKLYPKYKTFIDCKNTMMGNKLMEKYLAVKDAKPGWEKVLLQDNVNFIITSIYLSQMLISALDTSPNWSLIYFDDASSIYLRKTDANLNLTEKYRYRWVKLSDPNFSYIKNTYSLAFAIAEFKRKISEDPSCVIAHLVLASLLEKSGDIRKAEEEYRFACEYSKYDADILLNLSAFYLRYGMVDFALETALQAYKKTLDLAGVTFVLGECYLAKNETKEARNYFQKALKLNTDKAAVLTKIGLCYAREKDFNKAKKKFTEVIGLNPSFISARLNLAECHKEQMNLDAAEAEFRECLKFFPNSAEVFYNLASIKALQGNQKEALKFLKESIKHGGTEIAMQAVKDPAFVFLLEDKEFRSLIGY